MVLTVFLTAPGLFQYPAKLTEFQGWWWKITYILIIALALVEMFNVALRIIRHRFYRPDFTVKAYLIVLMTILATLGFPLWQLISPGGAGLFLPFLALMTLLTPLINSLLVALFYPLTLLSKRIVLTRASRKIAQQQGLKVIGITGSYGKSSTKEFLTTILGNKFNVLKTPGNTNTEIGVARIILKHLKPEHDVFIVEAGAYKIGEIRKICRMVVPRVAVVTAVKDSHLALFGSLQNIQKAKFELIESLPQFGTAIFNFDNEGSRELSRKAEGLNLAKIVTYGSDPAASLRATDIEETIEGVSFKVEGVKFFAPVPGKHNVSNLLAALAAGLELGLTLAEMAEQAGQVRLREHTLSTVKISDKLILLDDTYNANPDGVTAALDYLNLYNGWQKIIVFPGMLELGEKSETEHQRVAEKITGICDYAYFTSRDFSGPLMKVLEKKHYRNYQFIVSNQQKLHKDLKDRIVREKSVVLFVSRGSEQVLKKLQHEF
jgi:UDP-N-acetylmuramoyl-tripeptide--D-alanyl-D-alanine ligase